MAWIIVIIMRVLAGLTIFRWPLAGGLLSILADNLDIVILGYFHVPDISPYNRVDKILDTYYLTIEVLVSLDWKNKLARKISIISYIYRLVGAILFEITNARFLLLIFPNLFENFFIFYLAAKKILKKDLVSSPKNATIIIILLLIPKLIQEYFLHVLEFPIWGWIIDNVFTKLGVDKYFR